MNRGHQLDEIDRLRAENERLREELREVRVLISDYWEPEVEVEGLRGLNEYLETRLQDRMVALEDLGVEVERLRKEHEYMTVKTAQYDDMVTENERLREQLRLRAAGVAERVTAELRAENEGLRGALEQVFREEGLTKEAYSEAWALLGDE